MDTQGKHIYAVSIAAFDVHTGILSTTACAFTVSTETEAIGKAHKIAEVRYPRQVIKIGTAELTKDQFPTLALDNQGDEKDD